MGENELLHAYAYLTPVEVHFLDAAVERLIPTDDLGPGAREAGVTCYIDRQLSSTWGTHGRNYRSGPWPAGTPEQGFQSRFTPQEIYRIAIREIDDHCRTKFEKPFAQLAPLTQDALLQALEKDEIELPSLSSKLFFDMLLRNTEEGFFADPMYGGNRDKIGWKLLGFPGLPSGAYRDHIGNPATYRAQPVSILDVQTRVVEVDANGFAKHVVMTQQGGE